MQVRTYDHNGEKRYITEVLANEVEFLDFKKDAQDGSGGQDVSDEEIPF